MARTYKAALFFDDGDHGHIEYTEKTLPDVCGDDDVIVKNRIAGICGADYMAYAHGDGPSHMLYSGQEFGHEMVSEVIEKGKNVKGVEIGDWIFPNMGYAYHDRGAYGNRRRLLRVSVSAEVYTRGRFYDPVRRCPTERHQARQEPWP